VVAWPRTFVDARVHERSASLVSARPPRQLHLEPDGRGDPLADVGDVLATWPQTEEEARAFPDAPALLPGFASRDALLERYARCSGRDLSDIEYHIAFSYFRLACISQGVYKRALDNAHGHVGAEIEAFRLRAKARAQLAHRSALALS
jgi:aminoglycoside phosphotransferase (APT) family kinase protein